MNIDKVENQEQLIENEGFIDLKNESQVAD
jgi:hypothetical protein